MKPLVHDDDPDEGPKALGCAVIGMILIIVMFFLFSQLINKTRNHYAKPQVYTEEKAPGNLR